MSSQSLMCFILKEVRVRGLLGPTGVHPFPSEDTECLQTPVGRRSNVEVHWLMPRRTSVPAEGWAATHCAFLEERYISRALERPRDNTAGECEVPRKTLSGPLCELP